MQKFTRALTREIEVGGERVALTLDEKGLSVRPVGSRKPPRSLSWAAVLCALADRAPGVEPDGDELARALQTIHAGSTVAPTPKPLAALGPAAELAELLARLDDWLVKNRKRYHDGLLPGADDKQLAELADALGRPVPDELAGWLRWHNGQNDELIGAFVESFNLMSVADIVQTLLENRKSEKGWDPAFIPLLDDYQDDLVVLDTRSPDLPVREVRRGREDHPEVATSMRGWLAALLADFEAGRYHEDPERGDYMRSSL